MVFIYCSFSEEKNQIIKEVEFWLNLKKHLRECKCSLFNIYTSSLIDSRARRILLCHFPKPIHKLIPLKLRPELILTHIYCHSCFWQYMMRSVQYTIYIKCKTFQNSVKKEGRLLIFKANLYNLIENIGEELLRRKHKDKISI